MKSSLRQARQARGLTLIQVSHALCTDIGNLSRIERGMGAPSAGLALELYEFYGREVSLEEILRSSPTQRKPPGCLAQPEQAA